MIRAARLFALLIGTALLCHYLPNFYEGATRASVRTPSFNYSSLLGKLLVGRQVDGETLYMDLDGNRYTREEYEALTPFNHFAQLARDGRIPEPVRRMGMNQHILTRERTYIRIRPQSFETGLVNLRPLLEAESGLVQLEIPPDFLRLGEEASFLVPAGNTIDADKSRLYTEALRAAGVQFPVVRYGSFPTTHKTYDEGFILEDSAGVLFQLRQVRGQPDVFRLKDRGLPEQAALWDQLRPRLIEIQEQPNQQIRAVIVDTANAAWIVLGDNYKLVPLGLQTYQPENCRLLIRGDPLNYSALVRSPDGVEVRVYDRGFNELTAHIEEVPGRTDTAYRIGRWLFPLQLDFRHPHSVLLGLFWQAGAPGAFLVSSLLALGYLAIRLLTRRLRPASFAEALAILAGGIAGLVVLLALPPVELSIGSRPWLRSRAR